MTKKKPKHAISTVKSVYLALIVFLPVYAGFALQLLPREHEGDPTGGQGWPYLVCGPVDSIGDFGLLLLNASMIFGAIYVLVILSAVLRFHFWGQAADGTPVKKSRKKR